MKEEIEAQRCVTRQAQRQLHTLQHALEERKKEIELVRRHLSAFEAQAKLPSSSAASTDPVSSVRQGTSNTSTASSAVSSVTVAVLAAGAQTSGVGARHRESIAAAAGLAENEDADTSAHPVPVTVRLKDQVQRQDLYKKKLKILLDRLSRHVQFVVANLESLRLKHESARRELSFFHDRVVQERNRCTDLEHRKQELADLYATHAHNAMLVLNSLREEIASRATMSQHRREADRRREQLLTLIQSSASARGGSSRATLSDRGSVALSAAGRSASRKNSLHVLDANKAQQDFAPAFFSAETALRRSPSQSARHRTSSIDMQQFAHHETFMQIYEGQYARVLEETRESDLSVVIERFLSFKETTRRLLQIESDASEQNEQLEREREAHSDLVRKLRVSGIAEVEKRKKIRDFLEQMHHVKAQVKSQARDKFVEQLKIFSLVQQGVGNIVELFKCLDDRVAPPGATLASPLSLATPPASVAHALADIVRFCVQVARANPGSAPIVFTDAQVASLREFVSTDVAPRASSPSKPQPSSKLAATVESSLGVQKTGKCGSGGGDAAQTHSVVGSLLRANRRVSVKDATSQGAKAAESHAQLVTPWSAKLLATPAAADSEPAVWETSEDADEMVSSESDTEETRRDMKRSEKDTLQQVEALLQTFETRQLLLSQEAHGSDAAAAAKLRRQRSGGRHNSVPLVVGGDGGATSDVSLLLLQQHTAGGGAEDRAARLEAVHAFFREKRRRERQEQQQQREMLALLSEASYSASQRTTSDSSARLASPHSVAAGRSMMARKRSNGVAALALHSAVQEQRQQQAGARRSLRPRTVR